VSRAFIDSRAWDTLFTSIVNATARPTKILRAAMATRGYRGIIGKFKEERGPDGPWEKRAPSTQKRYADIQAGHLSPPAGFPRAAFNPSNRLLQLTGALRKSLMPGSLKEQTEDYAHNAILVFSPLGYSGTHDEGDPSRGIPARPFMWLSPKELDETADIVLKLALGGA
jgi:hypothetical protein